MTSSKSQCSEEDGWEVTQLQCVAKVTRVGYHSSTAEGDERAWAIGSKTNNDSKRRGEGLQGEASLSLHVKMPN